MSRIRKAVIALVIVAILAQASPSQAQDWLPLTAAIVKVRAGNQGGTGTLVAMDGQHGYVLTCKHVVGPYQTATATWRDGYTSRGPVVARGETYDTAIFQVTPPPSAVVIPVSEDSVPQGETVEVFGYGGQYGINVDNVKLIHWSSKVRGYKTLGEEQLLTLDPHSESGDSGGPVLYNGRVVGIIAGGQLASRNGPAIDAHGPSCHPIANLLRLVLPHGSVAAADKQRQQPRQQPGQQPGGT